VDEWPIGDQFVLGREVRQQKTLAARALEAVAFCEEFGLSFPLAVDSPETGDLFLNAYGAWPTRFFIMKNGKINFICEPCAEHYMKIDEVEAALNAAMKN
jgi:hypothetical protein